MNRRFFVTGASALMTLSRISLAATAPNRYLVLLGTRTNGPGKGIYSFFFDSKAGTCTPATLAGEVAAPTAFALSSNRKYLYATSELGNDGKSNGDISALSVDAQTGKLTLLNKISAAGGGPTYLALDATGKTITTACFGSGKANAFHVLPDGMLGEQTGSVSDYGTGPSPRQTGPKVHCTTFAPGNRFLLAADLGADRVFVYRFDQATGKLTPNDPPFYQAPPGTGPRQITFSPNGKFAYLMSEMGGTVTVLAWGAKEGTLTAVQTISCFPPEQTGDRSGAGIVMRQDGRFLYTTTRTDNSIEVFAVDASAGTLTLAQRIVADGKTPWGCALDPSGNLFITANLQSNSASIYRVDGPTGKVTFLTAVPDIPTPVTALFVPV